MDCLSPLEVDSPWPALCVVSDEGFFAGPGVMLRLLSLLVGIPSVNCAASPLGAFTTAAKEGRCSLGPAGLSDLGSRHGQATSCCGPIGHKHVLNWNDRLFSTPTSTSVAFSEARTFFEGHVHICFTKSMNGGYKSINHL